MEKKWMKIFNEKNIAVVMVIIFILSVIPLLIMAKYNIIQCDDFAYGYSTHKNWNGTIASLPNVIRDASEGTKWSYMNWQGTFSAIFMMRLHPGVFNERLSFFTTWIMLGMLTVGICFFSYVLFKKILKANKEKTIIIAIMWLILSVQFLPDENICGSGVLLA